MTTMLVRPGVWLSPEPAPIRGTLLDAATINHDIAFQDTSGVFNSFNCVAVDSVAIVPCPPNLLAVPVQAASSTATSGGTLAAGTYKAVITAVNTRGETTASNEISQTTTGATSTITWNWADIAGETAYRVYVTTVGGAAGSETLVFTTAANATSYVWTGTPAPDGATKPPTNNSATVPVTKTFNSPAWQDGFKFAVYAGVVCKAVGFDIEDAGTQLERVFTNKESVGVARAIMQTRFVASGGHWPAPTDLTPAGGAVDPTVGLAILEGHASWNYAGLPTIHAPRTIGSLLTKTGQVRLEGNMLVSQLGSKVAADGGYESPSNGPSGAAPAAGELWMYGSGEVTVSSSDPVFQQWDLDRFEAGDSNRVKILRERRYQASVDCYAAAVRVKVQ